MRYCNQIALLVLLLLSPPIAWGGELRIEDSRGVLRSVVPINQSAKVTIHIESSTPIVRMVLASTSGLAGDIVARSPDGKRFQFEDVTEGSWKIVAPNPEVRISKVEVSAQMNEKN